MNARRATVALTAWVMSATLAGGAKAATPPAPQPALSAVDFIASEGVNTHISYVDGAYRDVDRVLGDLAYLGIRNIRDGLVVPGRDAVPAFGTYAHVAAAGIRFLLCVSGEPATGHAHMPDLFTRLAMARDLLAIEPRSVSALEGPNEINNWPITFEGVGPPHELEAALGFQRVLYKAAHTGFPSLPNGLPVYYLTGYAAGGVPVGPDPLRVPGLADFNTQHPYPNHGDPPAAWVARARALPNTTDPKEPAVYTETGYASNGGANGVDADVQGKYTIDLLLDDAKQGIARTYLYELLDAYPTGSRQGNAGFGLFDTAGAPKPVARDIHAMNLILGHSAQGQVLRDVPDVVVEGLPETGNKLMLCCTGGAYVALWDEQRLWGPQPNPRIAATPHKVTIRVASRGSWWLTVFDPERGPHAVESGKAGELSIMLGDHAIFVRIDFNGL